MTRSFCIAAAFGVLPDFYPRIRSAKAATLPLADSVPYRILSQAFIPGVGVTATNTQTGVVSTA